LQWVFVASALTMGTAILIGLGKHRIQAT